MEWPTRTGISRGCEILEQFIIYLFSRHLAPSYFARAQKQYLFVDEAQTTGCTVVVGTATEVKGSTVMVAPFGGAPPVEVAFDYLVVATGFKMPGAIAF